MSAAKIKTQFTEVLATVKNGGRVGIYGKNRKTIAMIVPFVESEKKSSYEIGKTYFGKYGSGKGSLSQNHKKLLKQKLHGKFSSH